MTVQTRNAGIAQGAPHVGSLGPGRYVVLSVSDRGVGISPDTMEHLFEPFFTTKPIGDGTGLGLASVYGIVHQLGGAIDVISKPGHGAVFDIYLPRLDVPLDSPPVEPERGSACVRRGSGAILVVEDEPSVSRLTCQLLRRLGYATVSAPNGQAALALLNSGLNAFDLVLADIAMPGMSGVRLASEVASIAPALPVLLMSGYAGVGRPTVTAQGSLLGVIEKPFDLADLAARIKSAIG